jgi:hypothetical protein
MSIVFEPLAQRGRGGCHIGAPAAEQLTAQVPQEQGQDVSCVLHHLELACGVQDASVRSVCDFSANAANSCTGANARCPAPACAIA